MAAPWHSLKDMLNIRTRFSQILKWIGYGPVTALQWHLQCYHLPDIGNVTLRSADTQGSGPHWAVWVHARLLSISTWKKSNLNGLPGNRCILLTQRPTFNTQCSYYMPTLFLHSASSILSHSALCVTFDLKENPKENMLQPNELW